jgi:hypothetical protein
MVTPVRPFKVGVKVYDTWWPHRFGVIKVVTKTRVVVEWLGGEVWRYDQAHTKFLRRM